MRKRKRRKKKSGWIYVFHKNRKIARDHYKIGKTTSSVASRLSHARTGSSWPVEEVARYRVRNVHRAEKKLHKYFANKQVQPDTRNEWYRLNSFDLIKIKFLLIGE